MIFTQLTSILFKKDGMIVNTQMLGSERGLFFFFSFERLLRIDFEVRPSFSFVTDLCLYCSKEKV